MIESFLSPEKPDWEAILRRSKAEGVFITFSNPYSYKFLSDSEYIRALKGCDYVFADGMLVSKFASALMGKTYSRLSFDGNSIAPEVFSAVSAHELDMAVVGASPRIAEHAVSFITKEYSIPVVIARSGYFSSDDDRRSFVAELASMNPGFILIGMGVPRQEKFILEIKSTGWRGLCITCGGYLDQIVSAGSLRYYPEAVNRNNFRWVYRLVREPKKLFLRYSIDYSRFYWYACKAIGRRVWAK